MGNAKTPALLPVPDERPEFFIVERPTEFPVVTFLTVSRAQRAKLCAIKTTTLPIRNVPRSRTMAALAANIGKLFRAKLPPITTRRTEAHRVARYAIRVRIRVVPDERRERSRVLALHPRSSRGRMAVETCLAA